MKAHKESQINVDIYHLPVLLQTMLLIIPFITLKETASWNFFQSAQRNGITLLKSGVKGGGR